MPNAITGLKLFARMMRPVISLSVGIARTVLRGIVSIATKIDMALPDIKQTIEEVDPGKSYAEWAQQYRTEVQGNELEKTLITWPNDKKIDTSVMTYEHFRRARKYRYIFTAEVVDLKMGTKLWKMFSMYSNKQLSPDELRIQFENEYFRGNYENQVSINQIILKRVQAWTGKIKK